MTLTSDGKFEGKTDLWFGKWQKEFDKFWPEHSKVLKTFTLLGSVWVKYILFQLKHYRGIIFHDTEEWCKIWRGTALLFQISHEKFDKFWPKHLKVSKILTLIGSFWPKYKLFDLKCTKELPFVTLKSDTKFEEKLTSGLEKDRRNLENFHQSTWKSQNWHLDSILLRKVENV